MYYNVQSCIFAVGSSITMADTTVENIIVINERGIIDPEFIQGLALICHPPLILKLSPTNPRLLLVC